MGVYDCKSSATRLRHELNHVGRRFSEAVRFDLRLWRSDVLSLADFRYELDADMLKTCLFVVAFSGAGTQVLRAIPWFVLQGDAEPDQLSRAIMMGAGWLINIVIAEWLIRTQLKNK